MNQIVDPNHAPLDFPNRLHPDPLRNDNGLYDIAACCDLANRLLKRRWPEAIGAFIGGSVLRGQGKPNSDIDMLVLMPLNFPRPYKIWLREEGMPFDIFCQNENHLKFFIRKDWGAEARPVMLGIIRDAVLSPNAHPILRKWQRYARYVLDRSPPLPEQSDLDILRYRLMDLIEDCEDAYFSKDKKDRDAVSPIASQLHIQLLDALCVLNHKFLGNSKWRARYAFDANPEVVKALNEARDSGNFPQFLDLAQHVLGDLGGVLEQECCNLGPENIGNERLYLFSRLASQQNMG